MTGKGPGPSPKKFYCASVSLDWISRQPDEVICGMLLEGSKAMNASEIRLLAGEKILHGYDSLPACNNVDQYGRCRGHKL